jgi:hypothetical protein
LRRRRMHSPRLWRQEDGGIMVVALIMLVLISIIGIAASSSTSIEMRIAANEQLYRIAFYAADGATEAATVLLERDIEGRGSVVSHQIGRVGAVCDVEKCTSEFWSNLVKPDVEDAQICVRDPGSGLEVCDVDLYFSRAEVAKALEDPPMGEELTTSGVTLSPGGAISLTAGYEGKGKAVGVGGAFIDYDIDSQSMTTFQAGGSSGARARIHVTWRHVL